MAGWTDGWMEGRMDGWMDGWMDGRPDGWMDGRPDGRTYAVVNSAHGTLLLAAIPTDDAAKFRREEPIQGKLVQFERIIVVLDRLSRWMDLHGDVAKLAKTLEQATDAWMDRSLHGGLGIG